MMTWWLIGLDDVVQRVVFPVGDPGTGGIQRHAKWCGPEHTGHLDIGTTPVGRPAVVLTRGRLPPATAKFASVGLSRQDGLALTAHLPWSPLGEGRVLVAR